MQDLYIVNSRWSMGTGKVSACFGPGKTRQLDSFWEQGADVLSMDPESMSAS